MKTQRIFFFMIINILKSNDVVSQTYFKVTYHQDTFYTFNTSVFFDPAFKKPVSVPDGKWIILTDSTPNYFFNTYQNCIHGKFIEYWDGIIRTKGAYRMDSLWTFKFNIDDERFRDSIWLHHAGIIFNSTSTKVVGFQFAYEQTYNKWYSNGIKEYEKRGKNIEVWYYESGTIKRMITTSNSDKDEITIEQSFDTIGRLNKIITIRTTRKGSVSGIFVSSDIIEYDGIWKTKETIENKKQIMTILYGNVGQEVKRTSKKKHQKNNTHY